jgi:hypothetical protein
VVLVVDLHQPERLIMPRDRMRRLVLARKGWPLRTQPGGAVPSLVPRAVPGLGGEEVAALCTSSRTALPTVRPRPRGWIDDRSADHRYDQSSYSNEQRDHRPLPTKSRPGIMCVRKDVRAAVISTGQLLLELRSIHPLLVRCLPLFAASRAGAVTPCTIPATDVAGLERAAGRRTCRSIARDLGTL